MLRPLMHVSVCAQMPMLVSDSARIIQEKSGRQMARSGYVNMWKVCWQATGSRGIARQHTPALVSRLPKERVFLNVSEGPSGSCCDGCTARASPALASTPDASEGPPKEVQGNLYSLPCYCFIIPSTRTPEHFCAN